MKPSIFLVSANHRAEVQSRLQPVVPFARLSGGHSQYVQCAIGPIWRLPMLSTTSKYTSPCISLYFVDNPDMLRKSISYITIHVWVYHVFSFVRKSYYFVYM